jgi:WD40 repeat protein
VIRTLFLLDKRIISGSYDGTIKVMDKYSGKLFLDLRYIHHAAIVKVQADYTKIVSCSQSSVLID